MRILMLTCHPNIRGPFPKLLALLAAGLRSQSCIVAEEPWGRHQDHEAFFTKVIGRIGDIARVWRKLHCSAFDLLLLQTTTEWRNYSRDIPMLWLCRGLVRHVVVQFHGSTPEVIHNAGHGAFRKATRTLLSLTDGVLVSSSEEQRLWREFYPKGRIHVTSNPFLPLKGSGQDCIKPPWRLPEGILVLLYVGRMIVQKGVFDLLDAAAQLKSRSRIPFHLLMVGSGPAEKELNNRIQSLGLGARITVTGYVDNDALHWAYEAADVFVFPSWSEGFPTVIAEALDAGLPIVTTRIRGAADHLQEGIHACFVPPRNPTQLADALEGVMGDPELRDRMRKANKAKVKEFAPETVARQYLTILKQIVGPSLTIPDRELLPSRFV